MNTTEETFIILERIKNLVEDISSALVPFMKDIQSGESKLVDEISTVLDVDRKKSSHCLSELLIETSDDASRIKKELNMFKESLMCENESFDYDSFLSKVWHGDVYDELYDKGLEKLESELIENFKNSNEESIVQLCIKKLKN